MSTRFNAVLAAQSRESISVKGAGKSVTKHFESNVFNRKKRKEYLGKAAFEAVENAINDGKAISKDLANEVAEGLKNWALENGATHYTHWFQPLTGSTAEKHDSFFEKKDDEAIDKFSGSSLVQQEPDASSLPNGGLRATFEARGYTAWDPSSPAFIFENTSGKTLCIPTVFVSYLGHALDFKAPLLKSVHFLNDAVTKLNQKYFDKHVKSCTITLGVEQEYFLVDKALYFARPDLVLCGRTLVGHAPAKGQQMDDHYFGSIPDRVFNFMYEVELEALKLGIPLKTRHNEVAPGQYECAPLFEDVNLAVDHNQLLMDLMDEVADKHHFKVLFHEKPFAGVNGSGKHNNWSVATDTGTNMLSPGKNPSNNLQFLTFFINTIKAVHDNADIIRASIASASNDHRLGANEAPPAIISVFVGSMLTKVLDGFLHNEKDEVSAEGRIIDIAKIPSIMADNTDRNRTSPFAFTGNKFELRAVGSSKNSAQPMTALNSSVANQINLFMAAVDKRIESGDSQDVAIKAELKITLESAKDILFEGNNYSDEWKEEAQRRGLSNITSTPDCLDAYISTQAKDTFIKNGIFTEEELEARIEIMYEEYVKKVQIEGRVLEDLIKTYIVPSAGEYLNQLVVNATNLKQLGVAPNQEQIALIEKINNHTQQVQLLVDEMVNARKVANKIAHPKDMAKAYQASVKEKFDKIRYHADRLERVVDDSTWRLPKYRELLFIK